MESLKESNYKKKEKKIHLNPFEYFNSQLEATPCGMLFRLLVLIIINITTDGNNNIPNLSENNFQTRTMVYLKEVAVVTIPRENHLKSLY